MQPRIKDFDFRIVRIKETVFYTSEELGPVKDVWVVYLMDASGPKEYMYLQAMDLDLIYHPGAEEDERSDYFLAKRMEIFKPCFEGPISEAKLDRIPAENVRMDSIEWSPLEEDAILAVSKVVPDYNNLYDFVVEMIDFTDKLFFYDFRNYEAGVH